ncbi:kinase-like domain-containing protein [Rhizophagus irregularis DAOM 181602=DAOM 197198]|uniref:Kinase-like domain-containing protein n=1 Tax=Rhizophagus irregularis (strain DAOM 181602 / DAOM 197198 / MUCL 43194) TaxID=747089 RepID=A0A2P4P087_RHIID|nr:kinase-like domain-containing protein [Rhizophagus irregularis DAOM 181602=DAOM 197198]POG58797.1 kinase-like domain-containing protein [Rhizophagus irregularis DAOM 181602=DAOM 197198]|eukprot:XP_025165663.1 kinase-like domain-containing protein [Rhizophagus irregularis DAOM 181602=DAOM 197198]
MELKNGSLRQYLDNNFILLIWEYKLLILVYISHGLDYIHTNGLIHQDFHCGNILSNFNRGVAITELGLCQPANVKSSQNTQNSNKKIYGVLPYVAPEVLRGKEYTKKSNIYGIGIIAYEICTGFPPYYDIAHDDFLAMKICNGLRPKSNYKIPQLIFDIINQCWDADPSKRPSSDELVELFDDLWLNIFEKNCIIKEQINDADEINKNSFSSFSTAQSPLSSTSTLQYMTHPQAVYISRILDFKDLSEPKNANGNDDLLEIEHSESIKVDFTKLNINSEDCN